MQKGGEGVQKACKIAYIIIERPLMLLDFVAMSTLCIESYFPEIENSTSCKFSEG